MTYAISRRISNLEDIEVLAKEEVEEVVKASISGSEMPLIYLSLNIDELVTSIVDWSFILPISLFFLRLFVDFRIPNIIKTPSDIRSNF